MRIVEAVRRWSRSGRARRHVAHYEYVLGTSLELQLVASDRVVAERAERALLDEVDRLTAILSGWTDTSELARWQSTVGVDVPVSPELLEVLATAEHWRVRTGGAFHPGAQAVVELLRDGESGPRGPDVARVAALVGTLRAAPWSVDVGRGVARRHSSLPLSFDGIAKGYIVDRAAAAAHAVDGITEVLLNVGGDVRHLGSRATTVGVTDPFAPAENAPLLAAIPVRGEALATSGGYRRRFTACGRLVSHIVDPRTGGPAECVVSASVLAPDCATADALSTAFSVLPPAESVSLADALPGVACLLVEVDGTCSASARWRARAVAGPRLPQPRG